MTEQQAMRMALEALEKSVSTCFDIYAHEQVMSRPEHFVNQAITALRQALEQQPADEPVAWRYTRIGHPVNPQFIEAGRSADELRLGVALEGDGYALHPSDAHTDWKPLYTRPQPADELLRLRDLLGKANALARIRANEIESLKAKLKEKNT